MNSSDFKADLLALVTGHPAMDDEQLARMVGINPVLASELLRNLEAEGLIKRVDGYVSNKSSEKR